MIREISSRTACQGPQGTFSSRRFPLIALLVATSTASIIACSSDDGDGDTDEAIAPLETDPADVPARNLPAVPAPAMPGPASDTVNGLSLPEDMADWRVLGVVNVVGDTKTVRVILGNNTAVDAARAGDINPWPEGSMIGHLQWTPGSEPASGTAVTPGDFAAATLMVKDSTRFASDPGAWAFGVWRGPDLVPFPAAPAGMDQFDRACVNCHSSRVPDKDYVFTIPGALPTQAAVNAAPTLQNDVELPAGILDWSVIGVASREADANPNIRVIVGNDIAVEAARSGETDPWPDGAMLAHYVWAAGDNPDSPDTVNPVSFSALTLMIKNAGDYAADGGWAYGNWTTPELAAPTDDGFDRACVDCHTDLVADSDYVFTRPAELPDFFIDSAR